jgi:tripartite-type tricarboxylate transporter receptor subunit TctC
MRLPTTLFAVLLARSVLADRPAGAEAPCLSARLIVPWGSGGGTDLLFRTLAEAANRAGAKPPLTVLNASGGEGVAGTRDVLAAAPDGCTLLAVHQSLMTSFIAGRIEVNWDAFAPVARLTRTPAVLGARPGAGYGGVGGMLEAARASPDGISAGSTEGLASHFLFLMIEDRAGVGFRHVFFDGARERLSALIGGAVDLGEINQATARRHEPAGRLEALAVTGDRRLPGLPDRPTLTEQGIEIDFAIDRGVMLPKATPKAIVDRYAELFDRALDDPEVTAFLREHGTVAAFLGPQAYAGYWQDSFAEWRRLARAAGFYKPRD